MQYDIIVIGSGPGGYVAALHAAHAGKKVAIVESTHLGGICLNWGCIPTKALLQTAHVCEAINQAAEFGVTVGQKGVDLPRVIARSREVAANMSKGVRFLLDKAKVDIINGRGEIAAPGEVLVHPTDDGGTETYTASDIIIATGAHSRNIPTLPQDGKRIIGYKEALSLQEQPKSMAIVGSGAIGCEMAEFYNSIGTQVTIVEALPSLMPVVDEDVSKVVSRAFRKKKIKILTNSLVKRVEVSDQGCSLEVEGKKGIETLEAEVVLSAVGIAPNTEGLGLEKLGVKTDRGYILADHTGATNVPHIYAIGDVTTRPALAHVASTEAQMCVDHILGRPVDAHRLENVPSCTYTTPEVASVGKTEKFLAEYGHAYFKGTFQLMASGKATAMGQRDGFVKLLFRQEDRALVGAHIVGANATEMISELCLAVDKGLKPEEIYGVMHPHPTLSECVMEAAAAADGVCHHQ